LSQEQVPSLLIQHLPNRLRFTLQQKIARAAQDNLSSSTQNINPYTVFRGERGSRRRGT
jgi:hypothetical protein